MKRTIKLLFTMVLIAMVFTNIFVSSVEAHENTNNNYLSQDDINNILEVDKNTVATDEQLSLFFDELSNLKELTDIELKEELDNLGLSDVVEISNEPKQLISQNINPLFVLLESFHADFINKVVTSTFFNVDLYFYHFTKYPITQFAGYVYFETESSPGSWMSIAAPYIDERNISISTMKVRSYTYSHYGLNARYTGRFIVVYDGEIYEMLKLTENK